MNGQARGILPALAQGAALAVLLAAAACAGAPQPETGPSGAGLAAAPESRLAVASPQDHRDPSAVAIVPVEGARPNIHVGSEEDAAVEASKALALALIDPARETELKRILQRAAVEGFLAKGDCDLIRVRLDLDFTFAGAKVVSLPSPSWVMPATLQGCGRIEQSYLAVHVPADGAIVATALEATPLGTSRGAAAQ